MERLHRVIEEEKWEIEHNRAQEREELTEMYRVKGLTGRLLEEVVDVLMADDNRLLRVMLEEELGLTLEVYEHPLKQSVGAAIGVALTALLCFLGLSFFPSFGLPLGAALSLVIATVGTTIRERTSPLNKVVWNLSMAILVGGSLYFLLQMLPHG